MGAVGESLCWLAQLSRRPMALDECCKSRGGQAFSRALKHADTVLRGSKDLDFSVRQVRGPGRENSCREGGDFGLTEFSLLSLL